MTAQRQTTSAAGGVDSTSLTSRPPVEKQTAAPSMKSMPLKRSC